MADIPALPSTSQKPWSLNPHITAINAESTANAAAIAGRLSEDNLEETFGSPLGVSVITSEKYGVTPATLVSDASVSAGSTSVSSPSGKFTPAMNGQYFYLQRGGPTLVSGTNSWEPSPLVGLFTYVSSTSGTLSAPATTAVTSGSLFVGPDAAPGINQAISEGHAVIPAGVDVIVATEIHLGSGQSLSGGGRRVSRIFSVVPKANVIVSAWSVAPLVSDLSVYGNGWGSQPANVDPGTNVWPNLTNSGCGITFANVRNGLIQDCDVYHCGGDAVTTDRNGIAGIYVTMGCIETKVMNCTTTYCRNGINEDNYFSGSGQAYNPLSNTFENNTTDYNRFGIALDSGSLARGAAITNHVARYNVLTGVDVHTTGYVTITAPRVEFNGRGSTLAAGISIYGTSSTVAASNITLIGALSFANGTHGIRIADWITDWKVLGGSCANNFGNGIYVGNNSNDGIISAASCRSNNRSNTTNMGVRIIDSQRISVDVNAYDNQTTPTQTWGLYCDDSADSVTLSDTSRFSGNVLGAVRLAGANSKIGRPSRGQLVSSFEGHKGETFQRLNAQGGLAFTSGQLRATAIGLYAGERITSLVTQVTSAASGLTFAKLAIFDGTGTLLRGTVDASATGFNSLGVKSIALTSEFVVPADGAYYIGALFVGTTPPTLLRGTSGITGLSAAGASGSPFATAQSSLTDLPNPLVIGSGSANAPWFAYA